MFKLVAQIRSTSSLIDNYLLLLKHGDNLLLQYFVNNVHVMKLQNILTLYLIIITIGNYYKQLSLMWTYFLYRNMTKRKWIIGLWHKGFWTNYVHMCSYMSKVDRYLFYVSASIVWGYLLKSFSETKSIDSNLHML